MATLCHSRARMFAHGTLSAMPVLILNDYTTMKISHCTPLHAHWLRVRNPRPGRRNVLARERLAQNRPSGCCTLGSMSQARFGFDWQPKVRRNQMCVLSSIYRLSHQPIRLSLVSKYHPILTWSPTI